MDIGQYFTATVVIAKKGAEIPVRLYRDPSCRQNKHIESILFALRDRGLIEDYRYCLCVDGSRIVEGPQILSEGGVKENSVIEVLIMKKEWQPEFHMPLLGSHSIKLDCRFDDSGQLTPLPEVDFQKHTTAIDLINEAIAYGFIPELKISGNAFLEDYFEVSLKDGRKINALQKLINFGVRKGDVINIRHARIQSERDVLAVRFVHPLDKNITYKVGVRAKWTTALIIEQLMNHGFLEPFYRIFDHYYSESPAGNAIMDDDFYTIMPNFPPEEPAPPKRAPKSLALNFLAENMEEPARLTLNDDLTGEDVLRYLEEEGIIESHCESLYDFFDRQRRLVFLKAELDTHKSRDDILDIFKGRGGWLGHDATINNVGRFKTLAECGLKNNYTLGLQFSTTHVD